MPKVEYSVLADQLLRRAKHGEARCVPLASTSDLQGFEGQPWKCHDNVNRWCEANLHHRPARGWLVTTTEGGALFDKHSVVDRGPLGLLDITPLRDRSQSEFLAYEGTQEEFDNLPDQVVAIDAQ